MFDFSERYRTFSKKDRINKEWSWRNRSKKKIILKSKIRRQGLVLFYVKLATIQLSGQTNEFALNCRFQKGPKRFGCSRFKVVKNAAGHFVLKLLCIMWESTLKALIWYEGLGIYSFNWTRYIAWTRDTSKGVANGTSRKRGSQKILAGSRNLESVFDKCRFCMVCVYCFGVSKLFTKEFPASVFS